MRNLCTKTWANFLQAPIIFPFRMNKPFLILYQLHIRKPPNTAYNHNSILLISYSWLNKAIENLSELESNQHIRLRPSLGRRITKVL